MEELSSQHNSHLLLALKALLQKQEAGTQEEIRAALEKQGFLVNQTKISRLLQQIGAIKIREHEHVVYRLS
ncbi:MAG: ArgR family transcriptional regulator, partial [Gammaproteobacteria bacterium]